MRTRNWAALLMSLLVLVMVGCGGGGGGSDQPGGTVLSGTAMKGPIAGGTVKVFEIISSATLNPRAGIPRYGTTVLDEDVTDSAGNYTLSVPASIASGALMVQITGGSYTDEATGASRNVATQFGANGLRAVFGYAAGMPLNVAVTPFTEMAVLDMGTNPTTAIIGASNAKIAAAFGLADIISTQPLNPNAAFPAGSSTAAQQYALALATISQYQKDFGAGQSLDQIFTALTTQIADPANSGGLAPATGTQVDASTNNFAGGANNPNPVLNTPTVNPNAPAAIQTAVSVQEPAQVSTPVTVTANVSQANGTPVPDGTVVTFTTDFGTLSAASATTTNGQASVTLTSTGAGVAAVTVTSGSTSSSVGGITFVAPDATPVPPSTAPASIALGANSTPGFTTGPAVVISANVAAASGAVPDGTSVSFSIVSGSGTLSAASATTTGGIATVTLSSSVAGASVGVRAVAGSVSAQISVPFAAAPPPSTDPAGITLTGGSGFINGPAVAVTATVVTSSGAEVPDGTSVSFSIVSGSGTLSAASATTSGGVAGVSLTGTVAGTSVVVRAVAGSVSATKSVPFEAATRVTVKLASSGTLPTGTLIGGINATVTYATDKGLAIVPAGVAATGAGAGTLLERNTNGAGQVVLGLITTTGIELGEFATLTFSVTGGNFPTANDFAVASGVQVIDTVAGTLSGVAVGILSVTVE